MVEDFRLLFAERLATLVTDINDLCSRTGIEEHVPATFIATQCLCLVATIMVTGAPTTTQETFAEIARGAFIDTKRRIERMRANGEEI
jgi:hypothetical protein